MGAVTMRTFTCDAPGCKSNCTLSAADLKNPKLHLRQRGWLVFSEGKGDTGDADEGASLTTYCPGCKHGKQPTPQIKTEETIRVTVIESSE